MHRLNLTKGVVGFDLETTSLDRWKTKILAAAFSDGTTDVVITENFEQIIPLLGNPDIIKVIHNSKFDIGVVMASLGCRVVNVWDTQAMQLLMNMGRKRGVDFYAGLQPILEEQLGIFLDKSVRESFIGHSGSDLTREQTAYAAKDANVLIPLYHHQVKEIDRLSLNTAAAIENELMPIVTHMEMVGMRFDPDHWSVCRGWLVGEMDSIALSLGKNHGLAYQQDPFTGRVELVVNLKSPDQVKRLLLNYVPKVEKTGSDELGILAKKYPQVKRLTDAIIEYRHWATLKNRGYDALVNPHTDRMTSLWHSLRPVTGRFSCSGDMRSIEGHKFGTNMQSIRSPERGAKKDEPDFRRCFVPDPDHVFVIYDWSKQEIGVLASRSGDKKLIAGLYAEDIYEEFAKELDVDRDTAKTGVLAVNYGAQAEGLALRLGISAQKAQVFINKVRTTYSRAAEYSDAQHQQALVHGLVRSASGRIRFFDNPAKFKGRSLYRGATNMPVQGSAADMLKVAMLYTDRRRESIYKTNDIDIFNNFEGIKVALHDELVIQVHKDVAIIADAAIKKCMIEAGERVTPGVPIRVDGGISETWSH